MLHLFEVNGQLCKPLPSFLLLNNACHVQRRCNSQQQQSLASSSRVCLVHKTYSACNCWTLTSNTHTQPFNGLLSGTTRVGRYQKKHSPTHTHPDVRTSFIIFLHLQWSTASSLFSLRAWQSSRITSLQVLFGLPLGLGPSTSYSMHFFTQPSSSFRSTCPYQRSLKI